MNRSLELPDYLQSHLDHGSQLREKGYRGRFAPSPTGPMHWGNIRTALISWLRARLFEGTWILRIDDLDTPRNRSGAVETFQEDLKWLGLHWDGPIIFQSDRLGIYQSALLALKKQRKIYACRCTRRNLYKSIDSSKKRRIYPGICRNLDLPWEIHKGRLPSLRLKVDKKYEFSSGDVILKRADGYIAYNLATVIDELSLGISEVVRGADLASVLPAQLAVINSLQQEFTSYKHVPIMLDRKGRKLSKRYKSEGLSRLKSKGIQPSKIIGWLAYTLNLVPKDSELSSCELLGELISRNDKLDSLLKN